MQTDIGHFVDGTQNVKLIEVNTVNGTVNATFKATQGPGTATITATTGNASGNITFDLNPGTPSQDILLTANPSSIVADGNSTTNITSSIILDEFSNQVATGTLITVTVSSGTVITADADINTAGHQIATSSQGTISFIVQSSISASTATVSAQAVNGSAEGVLYIDFIPGEPSGNIILSAIPNTLIAGSGQTSSINSSVIKDANGNPVGAGISVTVNTTNGLINNTAQSLQITTDQNSKIQFNLTADTNSVVATAQVSASTDTGTAQTISALNIPFVAGPPAGTINLTSSPNTITADGSDTAVISSTTITDEYGNTVPEGTLITISTSWGTILEPDADQTNYPDHQIAVDATGIITFTVQSETVAGTAIISADSVEGTAAGTTQLTGKAGETTELILVLPGESFDRSKPNRKDGTPQDQVINMPFDVKVYPVDSFGNIVFDETMEIEISHLSSFTTCTPSFTQQFDGTSAILIFSIEDTIAGQNINLTATNTSDPAQSATSSPFNILAGDPVKLQILLPGQTLVPGDSGDGINGSPDPQQAGVPFDVIVNYVDQFYNIVTTAQGTIQLRSSGLDADRPENLSLQNGTCTFVMTERTLTPPGGPLRRLNAQVIGESVTASSDDFEVIDTLPPTVLSFEINSGAEFTSSQTVTLTIDAVDYAGSPIEMQFRNENQSWDEADPYEPYQTEKTGYVLSNGYSSKTVFIRVRDANGYESDEFSDTIYYGATPVADAGGPYSAVEGTDFTISGSDSSDPAGLSLTYQWDLDCDGEFDDQTGETFSHSFPENGVYLISLKVTNEYNQSDTAQTTVTVVNAPPVAEAGTDIICAEGEEITFSGSFTDPGSNDTHTYSWDFGDGSAAVTGTLSPNHTYIDDGSYIARLTVTDDEGAVSEDTLAVNVENLAPIVNAGSDITADGGEICSFYGSFTDPGSNDTHTYSWDFGDGSPPVNNTLTPTHVYADNDTYTVTLTVTDNNYASASDTLTVTILNVAPILTVDPDFDINEGDTIELVSTSYTDPETNDTHIATIIWDDGDITQFPVTGGQIAASHRYMNYGDYSLTVKVTDDDGASDLKIINVKIHRAFINVAIKAEDDFSATISFSAIGGKEYDIYYSDDDFRNFGSSLTWILADTVFVDYQDNSGNYNDNGDPSHPGADGIYGTADDGRLPPYQVDTRYYRVVETGTVEAGDPLSSEDVVFYHTKLLYEGRNYIAQIGVCTNQSLNEILDSRFLPGGLSMQDSTVVTFWRNNQAQTAYVLQWQNNMSWSDGSVDINDIPVDIGKGMILLVKPGNGTVILPMVGKVRMSDTVNIEIEQGGYTLVTWPYADVVELDNCGLLESGFTGGVAARTSDQIYFWNPITQRYDIPVFYFESAAEWRNYDLTPCTKQLKPSESVLIKLKSSSQLTNWTAHRKYIKSRNDFEL